MSRYVISEHPHPLDDVWTLVMDQHDASVRGIDAYQGDDDHFLPVVEARDRAVKSILALPARNFDDVLFKLKLAVENATLAVDFDISLIFCEADKVQRLALLDGRVLGSAGGNHAPA